MNVMVNGFIYDFKENVSMEDIIEELKITNLNIIAEINGEIVRRRDFGNRKIGENDRVEIVQFVGGG
ncbi:MAG: sulfur carrier protein ThiS [Mucispirillum sp.]|nr:sulfur carrier protein ThiS [Mucispirillum sp.]